ncbi:hypothetical protein O181_034086 [Austropuccinia psidii MF-1]|uniref:Uncharacterized protein n=1 Tax=Austropuccinia psidii MF-1 TaxID=1389203 RepID=A0A9Q3D000_9BASI|nr:hypothetical protein [Austropuccinia psidii MF-1]
MREFTPSEGLYTRVFQRTSSKEKSWLENQRIFAEDQKSKFAKQKDKLPMEAPQASTSSKQGQENSKDKSEGKAKSQVEQALPSELQNYKEGKNRHGQCVQYGKNFDGTKNKEEKRMNQHFPKK